MPPLHDVSLLAQLSEGSNGSLERNQVRCHRLGKQPVQQDEGERKSMTDGGRQPHSLIMQASSVCEGGAPQLQVTLEDERSGMVIEIRVGALLAGSRAADKGKGRM